MKKQSQLLFVKNKLETEGYVDNLFCIQNGIWRLGAIIERLRKQGMKIETIYGTPEVGKNCHYKLMKNTLF